MKDAFELGERLHKGQLRKSGEPYFSHPIAVAHMLADMGADADTLIAALLHDTVEDTPITLAEIDRAFNGDVRVLIDGVTKLSKQDLGEKPTLDGQIETLRKMFTLMEQDVRIMVMKLIDRLHNMQTVEFLPPEQQHALASETMDVYVKIADRLCMQDLRDELKALSLSVLEPSAFVSLAALRVKNEQKGQAVVEKMQRALHRAFPSLHTHALYEYQTWTRLQTQAERLSGAVTGLPALTCVFLCPDVDACYRTMGTLHQLWKREALSFQDYINAPQINGYQGLHTTVILEDGMRVRCKIRTEEMHAYARKGIAVHCFNRKTRGVMSTLAWTERISPLAEDTKERSSEFWQSLQSDILGESIVIHGPADETLYLPDGATALDAAFYLFAENAARLKSIQVNGVEVPLGTRLKHADAVSATLDMHLTVQREWLQWVQTGFAMARIRTILASTQSEKEKVLTGKSLLQTIMLEKRKGFIEEFREEGLLPGLQSLGFPSLRSAYIAVADGRIDPADAYEAIFGTRRAREGKQLCRVRYMIDLEDIEAMDRVNLVHRKYGADLQEVHYQRRPAQNVVLKLTITPTEQNALQRELLAVGAREIALVAHRKRTVLLIALLVMLWGLDPVVAHTLLRGPVSVFDLTFMRFTVFFLAAALLLLSQRWLARQQLKPIALFQPTLLLSGIALFLTGLSTYVSLSIIPPLQYILIIAGGVALTAFLRAAWSRQAWFPSVTTFIICIVSLSLLIRVQGSALIGLLFGFLSSLSFAFYSEVSRRYQEEIAMIKARYAEYLLWLSAIALGASLSVLPWTRLGTLPPISLLAMAGFAFVFVFLPYSLYYVLMRRMEIATLDRQLPFVCLATMLGEIVLTQSPSALFALPVLFALLWWQHAVTIRGKL